MFSLYFGWFHFWNNKKRQQCSTSKALSSVIIDWKVVSHAVGTLQKCVFWVEAYYNTLLIISMLLPTVIKNLLHQEFCHFRKVSGEQRVNTKTKHSLETFWGNRILSHPCPAPLLLCFCWCAPATSLEFRNALLWRPKAVLSFNGKPPRPEPVESGQAVLTLCGWESCR